MAPVPKNDSALCGPWSQLKEIMSHNEFVVVQASYCIKMTGVFEGKLGTKRFCSSRDWGNYCEYIQRPGDIQVN
jgi:hypothetical protein